MSEKTKWTFDNAHTELGFKIKHLMISHIKGHFTEYKGSIYTTGDDFTTAEIDVWINPDSLVTKDEKRDAHLKSADFFDTEHHKEISFVSDTFEKTDDDNFEMWGTLSIKGIAKKIKLNVEYGGLIRDPWGADKAGFTITGKINRKDWGLVWNTALESGGVLVGDTVHIICEVELNRD